MLQQSLFYDAPTIVRRTVLAMVAVIVLGLVGMRILAVLEPPDLVIESPNDLLSTSSRIVTIAGKTEPGATLSINGVSFSPDRAGTFTTDVILAPGPNTIAIEARTRHSRPAHIIRRVHVHQDSVPLAVRDAQP